MITHPLHAFDQRLCQYVAAVVGWHVYAGADGNRFASDLRLRLRSCELTRYLLGSEDRNLLLNDDEFDWLLGALEEPSMAGGREWRPLPLIHDSYISVLPSIRELAAAPVAERFATDCLAFADQLSTSDLELPDGVRCIEQWVSQTRVLKGQLGLTHLLPKPLGEWPTPTAPGPEPALVPATDPPSGGLNASSPTDDETVLTPDQAGGFLKLSGKQVRRLIEEGRLSATNVGTGTQKPRYRIHVAELTRFMAGGQSGSEKAGKSFASDPSTSNADRPPTEGHIDYFPD